MTLNRILTTAILIGLSTLVVACGDDGSVEPNADAGATTTTDIPTPDHECGYDAECEGAFSDLTPCEDAVCDAGTCVKATRSTWSSCVHPDAGVCEGGYCSDEGQCVLRTADDGAPCNEADWTACTIGECKSGGCVDVATVVCDDDNPCTDDACDPETGSCSSTANTALCDDGNPCTSGDVCADGDCAGTEINAVTEEGDVCTCTTDAECAIYDDGDLCNGVWGCVEGSCAELADSAVTCDEKVDSGGCRTNACNPGTGACEMTPVANYEPCDDGDSCTGCAPGEDCDNDGDYCQGGVCQGGNGAPCDNCVTEEDCAFLDDGDMCNGIWSCQKFVGDETGTCQPVPDSAVSCAANESDCFTSACEPTTGECIDSALACDTPPADSCEGLMATTYALVGVCSETEDDSDPCSYEAAMTDCDIPQDDQCVTSLTGDACDDDTPCADEDETCTDGLCTKSVDAQTWSYTPTCQGGQCDYDETITLCADAKPNGCVGLKVTAYEATGACNAEGVACEYTESEVEDCDVPKTSECVGANGLAEVRSYAPTCTEGACGHEMTATLCEQAASCEGDVLTTYDASCNEAGDGCGAFTAVETDCAANGQVCLEGACSDPCEPVTECAEMACGDIDDGCGGTLACGDCADGKSCVEGMCLGNIAEVAEDAGIFTSLLAALSAADLAETIATGGPFTVFAPTDEAFEASLAALEITFEELAEDTDMLSDILLYHVVSGEVPAAEVVGLMSATTLQGSDIAIEVVGETVVLNGSVNVTTTDVMASNGIIHIIDGVLMPPACVPATECSEGMVCGMMDDGCGGMIACGACAEGETCNAGVCEEESADLAPNGCPNDCEGCFDGETCTTTAEWWTCGEAQVCGWAQVELHVDMNSYGADSVPSFQGEFNEWCGACSNEGSDADMDGIYTFTQYLSPKTWQWKPSIGNWEVVSSAPAECQFDAENSNYFFEVTEADINSGEIVTVGPVCFADGFGSCGPCEAPAVCDPACGEGEVCEEGVCVSDAPTFDANGCPSDCMGCFDGETCTSTSAWWECGESTVCGWAHVELHVDMNNYDANQAPNFQGEFNEWCGECFNTGTDADMDGIYTFTQYLSPKTWQWKPSIGNWTVVSSAPAECQFDAENSNYFFDVAEADINSGEVVTVGPVCFADGVGTCGACVAECVPATECAEGMNCGTVDDGCGGTVDCGTCADGETCEANMCMAADDGCSDTLFISEYVEGGGSNKVIELYNNTGAEVDMSTYALWQGNNGDPADGSDSAYVLALEGSVAAGETFVVCKDGVNIFDAASICDQITSSSVMNFNGNDAIALVMGDVVVDQIGVSGVDPGGDGWAAGGMEGQGKDHTLVRASSVTEGSTDWDATSASEWSVLPKDSGEGIGAHTIDVMCMPECEPATECTEGMACGTMDDGCGGTIACGTCGDGETCNGNTCEADAPAFMCDMNYASCTEEDFAANDMTAMEGTIDINMVNFAPYSPTCLRVAVGQTVTIGASGSHPFEKVCAEDDVMDSQDGSIEMVTFTLSTPGYYNYKCEFHGSMVGNIHVVDLP